MRNILLAFTVLLLPTSFADTVRKPGMELSTQGNCSPVLVNSTNVQIICGVPRKIFLKKLRETNRNITRLAARVLRSNIELVNIRKRAVAARKKTNRLIMSILKRRSEGKHFSNEQLAKLEKNTRLKAEKILF